MGLDVYSKSSSSISRWKAGIYTNQTLVIYNNELYTLSELVLLPFTSLNFQDELDAGKWIAVDKPMPYASETTAGIVSTTTQTFKGNKCIKGDNTRPTTENTFEVRGINNSEKLLEIGSGGVNYPKFQFRGGQYGLASLSGRGDLKLGNNLGILGYTKSLEFDGVWKISQEHGGQYGIAFMNILHSTNFQDAALYIGGGDNVGYPSLNKVGIGTTTPQAKLDIVSTTSGVLIPRMTQVQRLAISLPAIGLQVYQTDGSEGVWIYKSTGWQFAY